VPNAEGSSVDAEARARKRLLLDLHTSEAPITTTRNDISIEDLGLEDMIVDGILNLFAVIRKATPGFQERTVGKNGIYLPNDFWVSRTFSKASSYRSLNFRTLHFKIDKPRVIVQSYSRC
jgi:hypothetical protein